MANVLILVLVWFWSGCYNYFAEYIITYSHTFASTLRKYWDDAPRVN